KQEDKCINYNCETCGKECEELLSHYNKKKHHYCSKECMDSIKQIKVNCKCCGKEFTIQKNVYNKSKS
ncbi:MAG TPA: hypothetical protein DCW51_06130, partial [Clostridium sp.]|nr:hypothetical protein [Clostridium sp.]